VPKQELRQVAELRHRKVVPAVPNAADALIRKAPDKSGDVCFLRRRDDSRGLRRDLYTSSGKLQNVSKTST
jgi:hypothetical protein